MKYPAAGGEHIIDVGEVIPEQLKDFMYQIAEPYQHKYDEVRLYFSDPTSFNGGKRIYDEEPFGEYAHYDIDLISYQEVKHKIKFPITSVFTPSIKLYPFIKTNTQNVTKKILNKLFFNKLSKNGMLTDIICVFVKNK